MADSITKSRLGTTTEVPIVDATGWGEEVTAQLCDVLDSTNQTTFWNSGVTVIGVKLMGIATSLANGGTLTPTHPVHLVSGVAGSVVLSSVTSVADGQVDGQLLILIGNSAGTAVTLQNGSNVALNGHCSLFEHEVLRLRWNLTKSTWQELYRSN